MFNEMLEEGRAWDKQHALIPEGMSQPGVVELFGKKYRNGKQI